MSFLLAFGAYLPEHVVDNAELAPLVGETPEWILGACGIEQRRYAAADETVESLAVRAAQDCLAKAGVAVGDVGMLIVASGSSERFCPGPAATVAAELGLQGVLALDVPVASAGSLVAMSIAHRFAESAGRVLVVASEVMSRRVELTPEGRNTAILFGDGAGACLVDAERGALEIKDVHVETDGTQRGILRMEQWLLHMEGGSVILQASRKIPAAVKTLLERNGVGAAEVGTVVMHQANRRLIEKVATMTGVPVERFFINIDRYGNTSSASMLIAAAEWDAARSASAEKVVFAAFGTGLSWGALLAVPA